MVDSNSINSIHLDGKLINIEKMSVDQLKQYLAQIELQNEQLSSKRIQYLDEVVLGKN